MWEVDRETRRFVAEKARLLRLRMRRQVESRQFGRNEKHAGGHAECVSFSVAGVHAARALLVRVVVAAARWTTGRVF